MRTPSITRGRLAFAAAAAVFVIARALPFAGAHVGRGFDSFDYLNLAHSKSLLGVLGTGRPPTFLIFLKLLGEQLRLVTWVQFAVATVAWITLAAAAARTRLSLAGRVGTVGLVFLVGSCLDVVQWDRLIATESLSISLGVLVIAAAFWLYEQVTPGRAAAFGAAALLWAMLRDANAIVIGVLGVAIGIVVLLRRIRARGVLLAVAGGCIAIAALSAVSSNAGARWQQPVQNIVTFRELPSPERRAYFLDHGLPLSRRDADRIAGRCVNPAGVLLCEKVTDRAFYDWIHHRARRVYVTSWFAFPATTLWEPITHAGEMIGTRFPVASITGTALHARIARTIETVMFPRSARVLVAWLLVDAAALALLVRRRGMFPAATIPLALVVLAYPHLWAVWNGDGVEMARHGLSVSVQLHLGLWLLTAALVDHVLQDRRGFALPSAPR